MENFAKKPSDRAPNLPNLDGEKDQAVPSCASTSNYKPTVAVQIFAYERPDFFTCLAPEQD